MKKILVVEDSQIILMKTKNTLVEMGFEVLTADCGPKGIEIAQAETSIQLIIADINMPGMSGLDMVEVIRQMPAHKETPIAMCTTESFAKLKERAKSLGVKAWLIKPIDDARLKKAMEAFFEKKAS